MTLNRGVAAEMVQWLIYFLLLALVVARETLAARKRLAIWFTPQRARPWYLARGAALWSGVRAARVEAEADIAFYFDDTTGGKSPPSRLAMLNGGCVNISKSHVATVFEQVFERPLRIDPRASMGNLV